MAAAKGKQIVIATNQPLTYINKGLVESGGADLINYNSQADLVEKVQSWAAALK